MKKFVEFLGTREATNMFVAFGYGVCCTVGAALAALWLVHIFGK